ncbi:MAG: hypothetical protein IJS37_00040 [Bacilli bacterium]|nr:hypothetical protein [Bacilli bacterium]
MANPKKLTSISVDSSTCQTTYFARQYFNPAGAVVTTYIYGPTNQLSTTDTHVTFIYQCVLEG